MTIIKTMNITYLRESALSKTKEVATDIADEFMDLFDNSTMDSTKLCIKGTLLLSKEITAAERATPKEESLKQYKKALTHAKRLRSEATKIPPDRWTDHMFRVLTLSYGTILNYLKAVEKEKDIKNMSRNDTVDKYDKIVKAIEVRIQMLEN